jgi:hypothetical protein
LLCNIYSINALGSRSSQLALHQPTSIGFATFITKKLSKGLQGFRQALQSCTYQNFLALPHLKQKIKKALKELSKGSPKSTPCP